MLRIDPSRPELIHPYIGKRVCAVLRDERCYYGVISKIHDGKVHFTPLYGPSASTSDSANKSKRPKPSQKRTNHKNSKTATTSTWGYPGGYFGGYPGDYFGGYPGGYPGYGYPGFGAGAFAIELAFIALLFTIPFAF